MLSGNKTFKVQEFLIELNNNLKDSKFSQDEKKGMCAVLETILFATKNYHGFYHLDLDETHHVIEGTEYNRYYYDWGV